MITGESIAQGNSRMLIAAWKSNWRRNKRGGHGLPYWRQISSKAIARLDNKVGKQAGTSSRSSILGKGGEMEEN